LPLALGSERVAQPVEHVTFNHGVLGSSPSALTNSPSKPVDWLRFSDGRPSVYFYWHDIPGRRTRPEQMTQEQALEKARAVERRESGRKD
jgi:hypothetical protein